MVAEGGMVDRESDSGAEPRRRAGTSRALALLLVVLAVGLLSNVLPADGSGEPRGLTAGHAPDGDPAPDDPVVVDPPTEPGRGPAADGGLGSDAGTVVAPPPPGVSQPAALGSDGSIQDVALSGAVTAAPPPVPDGLWDTPAPVPDGRTYVVLEGSPGEWISQGLDHDYDRTNALLTFVETGRVLDLTVKGDQQWAGKFAGPEGTTALEPGYYDFQADPVQGQPSPGGLSWDGEGRGCFSRPGWMAIDELVRDGAGVSRLTLRFEQRCDGGPALHGKLRWDRSDTTLPPGPVVPPPGDLYDVDPAVGPDQSYAAFEVDADADGRADQQWLFTQADAALELTETPGGSAAAPRVSVAVREHVWWKLDLGGVYGTAGLVPGYYGDVPWLIRANPARGGIQTSGPEPFAGCGDGLVGWFVVDEAQRSAGALQRLMVRFTERCADGRLLHGKVRWVAGDPTTPPGPVMPIPGGLWDSSTPTIPGRTVVDLETTPAGAEASTWSTRFTRADSAVEVRESMGSLVVKASGDASWTLGVTGPLRRPLEQGFYDDLGDMVRTNPAKGQMDWGYGPERCDSRTGWAAIDGLTRAGGILSSLSLRVEVRCLDGRLFHARVRWFASDTSGPPPPGPVPPGLWDVNVPDIGQSWLYLEQPGRWGSAHLLAGSTFPGSVQEVGSEVRIASGSQAPTVVLRPMSTLPALVPGYYGDLGLFGVNPVRASMRWTVDPLFLTCSSPTGWFAVDDLVRTGDSITSLTVRFEQRCPGLEPMRGKLVVRPPAPPDGRPIGALERPTWVDGGLRVAGWAVDPGTRSPVEVNLLIDGVWSATLADRPRLDLEIATGVGGQGGFSAFLPAGSGAHQVCAIASAPASGRSTLLGCEWALRID